MNHQQAWRTVYERVLKQTGDSARAQSEADHAVQFGIESTTFAPLNTVGDALKRATPADLAIGPL